MTTQTLNLGKEIGEPILLKLVIAFVIPILFGTLSSSQAQNLKEDLIKMAEAQKVDDAYYARMTLTWFPNDTTSISIDKKEINVCIDGKRMYQKIGHLETFVSPEYSLMLDHAEKYLFVQKAEAQDPTNPPVLDIDSLLDEKIIQDHSFEELPGNAGKYNLIFSQASFYRKAEIYFSKSSYQIQKTDLYLRDWSQGSEVSQPRMLVEFKELLTGSVAKEKFPSPLKFVRVKQRRVEVSPAYQSYQLYNYL